MLTAPMTRFRRIVLALTALLIVPAAALAGGGTAHPATVSPVQLAAAQSWLYAGQNLNDTHDQPAETAITPANVHRLTTKWTLTTAGDVSATPTVAGGVVYVPDLGGKLWAVHAATGQVIWSKEVSTYTGIAGDVSRTSPAIDGSELISGDGWQGNSLTAGAQVFAVNAKTGAKLWSVKVDDNLAAIITGSPVVYQGVAYVGISSKEQVLATQQGYKCCTFRGAVVAVNVSTGKLLWKTYTDPSNNGGGDTNKVGYYSGDAVWGSSPVADAANGLLYVGTGDNYAVPSTVCSQPGQQGCKEPIAADHFDTILALKMSTGAIDWSDKTITADAEAGGCKICGPDYDFGSSPNLFTTTNPATHQPEQLLGIGQKSGVYWAVNPANGKVAWHTQVGPGGTGGGIEWGSATDGTNVYSAETNSNETSYTIGGSGPFAGQTSTAGSWAALDAATGQMLWQTPDPQGGKDAGFMSTANGVVYADSNTGTGANMYALNASTGAVLWSFASGGSVRSGAAIVGNMVFWGSGYKGGDNDKLYAFGL